jgi:hypothetical protein
MICPCLNQPEKQAFFKEVAEDMGQHLSRLGLANDMCPRGMAEMLALICEQVMPPEYMKELTNRLKTEPGTRH